MNNNSFFFSALAAWSGRLAGAFSALLGVVVLAGWAFDIPWTRSVFPCAVELKANAAIGLILERSFGANPFGSSLHVFVDARRTKVKALYWHRNGFCLWYKRLERERFAWPGREVGATLSVTMRELEWLLEGFDLWSNKPHETLHFESVT